MQRGKKRFGLFSWTQCTVLQATQFRL